LSNNTLLPLTIGDFGRVAKDYTDWGEGQNIGRSICMPFHTATRVNGNYRENSKNKGENKSFGEGATHETGGKGVQTCIASLKFNWRENKGDERDFQ